MIDELFSILCQDKHASVTNATAFLEEKLDALTRPYAIAITAYALSLAGSDGAGKAIGKLKAIATNNEGKATNTLGQDSRLLVLQM